MNGADDLFRVGDQAILQWTLASTDYDQFRIEEHQTDAHIVGVLVAAMTALQQERDRAIQLIDLLVRERKEVRSHMAIQSRAAHRRRPAYEPNLLYRKVGLDQDCPGFILEAARKAYRKKLHPDVHPPGRRAQAERRFKEAEAVFAEIERQRGHAKPI
jgi:hypothetical protein